MQRRAAPPRVERHPIQVEVAAQRTGRSLRLEITGIGRGHEEGEPFENPETWAVSASVNGAPLKHILNGPARVDREPVGHAYGSQWNVFVRFSVAFAIDPEATHVDIRVAPPGAKAHEDRLEVSSVTASVSR